jgi:hypothetical protein
MAEMLERHRGESNNG